MSERNSWRVKTFPTDDGSGDLIVELPPNLLSKMGLRVGDALNLEQKDDKILLTPMPTAKPRSNKPYGSQKMSQLNRYRELEAQLAAQLQQLEEMKNSDSLKKEIEFEEKLKALMSDYGVNLRDIINLLDPQAGRPSFVTQAAQKGSRAPRAVKRYVNPDNGEVVETKGGNHSILKAWKAQYGAETVESWLQ